MHTWQDAVGYTSIRLCTSGQPKSVPNQENVPKMKKTAETPTKTNLPTLCQSGRQQEQNAAAFLPQIWQLCGFSSHMMSIFLQPSPNLTMVWGVSRVVNTILPSDCDTEQHLKMLDLKGKARASTSDVEHWTQRAEVECFIRKET
jgi:hypothetical protein